MEPEQDVRLAITRRELLGRGLSGLGASGIGLAALSSLLEGEPAFAQATKSPGAKPAPPRAIGALPGLPHFAPRAKRVVVLWQGGAPSHVDLFDHKPGLEKLRGSDVPDSVRRGTRLSTMTSGLKRFPVLPPIRPFKAYGKSGIMLSELLPHVGALADEMCLIRSMHTEAVNHAPGVTFLLTGSQIPGRPSLGAWATYGLGSLSQDLPAFVVMTSTDTGRTCGQLFYDYYWGAGFLPGKHQGVRLRSDGEPVLYLKNPDGVSPELRRGMLDDIAALNEKRLKVAGDPEIETRIAQYELAYKMQMSVPELLDIGKEPEAARAAYGPDVERPGSYARNCLLARRLLERGVRFVQLMHSGWDQHNNLPTQLAEQCRDTDQPTAALIMDLKQRGLLDDTIVLWAAEFGRTVFVQGDVTQPKYGRDHLGSCYSLWAMGGGFKGGYVHGESDDFCYNPAKDAVHVHDLQATLLHQLGIDHTRLTYRSQGRDFRLTDVYGNVVEALVR